MLNSIRPVAFFAAAAVLFVSSGAFARPFRVGDIPNGSKFGCLNCHGDTKASYNTDFGSDARLYLIAVAGAGVQEQHVDWALLCPFDSDKDGWTNGFELGDPDCTWKVGDPAPKGFLYNPGNPESAPPPVCGSGALEAFEECDGALLAMANCAEAGAGEGALGCTADCKFDYSSCSAPPGSTPPVVQGADDAGGCQAASGPSGQGSFSAAMMMMAISSLRLLRRKR